MTGAAILGCGGTVLTPDEASFFRAANPLGLILFQRNCESPDQIRRLVDDFRRAVGREDAPVLIDQEGGRVARLKPPRWRAAPAAERFGMLASRDRLSATEAVRLNAQLLAAELSALGITINCAPVLDLRISGASAGIGDRAFAEDAELVTELGRAACEGYLDGGVLPVIKHMPGHGRALVDSHVGLPRIEVSLSELRRTDFVPFQRLRDMPWGISAHVVYADIDSARPATTSPTVISQCIRGDIGFDGVLVTDDLSMAALSGSLGERVGAALAAGCELALHCNGKLAEMAEVAEAAGALGARTNGRIERGERLRLKGGAIDVAAATARLDAILAT
ncbi:MAG: beta-N-acetylhexosaminidase [Dongiaceae bacterium]